MKLFNIFKKRIELPSPKRNPLVTLMGYEKSYGKAEPTDFNTQVEAYNSWAYACINRIAFSVASSEFKLYKKGDKKTTIEEHPFLEMMQKVNPNFNRFELLMMTSIYMELTGNAYWWIVKNQMGVPTELWYLPSHWVRVVPSKEKFIGGYVMRIPESNVQVPFEPEEVVHFKYPSPHSLFYGMSPLMGAMYGVDLNKHIKTWGISFFMNNAEPAGILQTEGTLGDDAYNRLKALWNAKHRGSDNAGKIAILEQGLKYERTGSTIQDSQFGGISRDVRDEILGIFGVPASKLGLVEDVNRANAEANDYTFQKDTIQPRCIILQEKINEKLLPMYDLRLACKLENPIPIDKDYKLRERQANISSGFSTIDEEREKEGLEPFGFPETSAPLIPFSLTPAGTPKEEPQMVDDNEDDDNTKSFKKSREDSKWELVARMTKPLENVFTERMQRYFEGQRKDVMERFNKFRSAKEHKGLEVLLVFNLEEQKARMKVVSKPLVTEAYKMGIQLVNDEIRGSFDANSPTVARNIEHRLSFLADQVNDTTLAALKDTITEGESLGESIDTIASRIDKVFDYSESSRSKTIAMTELFGSMNMAQLETYKLAGVKFQKWITARDEKVRDSHAEMEGQTVGIGEYFISGNGGKMLYPSDRENGADASDTINCRCQAIAVRKKGE